MGRYPKRSSECLKLRIMAKKLLDTGGAVSITFGRHVSNR